MEASTGVVEGEGGQRLQQVHQDEEAAVVPPNRGVALDLDDCAVPGDVSLASEEAMDGNDGESGSAPLSPLSASGGGGSGDALPSSSRKICKTLWVGDIQPHWDESTVEGMFAAAGELLMQDEAGGEEADAQRQLALQVTGVKIIRNRTTGAPAGYGFVEFSSRKAAEAALLGLNGKCIPGTSWQFRLNWGGGMGTGRRGEVPSDCSLFVGDLPLTITDEDLQATFASRYGDVLDAKIVLDPVTRASKGFGFVRFGCQADRDAALVTMNGVVCGGRPMRVAPAAKRNMQMGAPGGYGRPQSAVGLGMGAASEAVNATIFVGGLNDAVTAEMLCALFAPHGEIDYVKVPSGRGCGFVAFQQRAAAEAALYMLQGAAVGACKMRLSWGKSQRDKHAQLMQQAVAAGAYYGTPPFPSSPVSLGLPYPGAPSIVRAGSNRRHGPSQQPMSFKQQQQQQQQQAQQSPYGMPYLSFPVPHSNTSPTGINYGGGHFQAGAYAPPTMYYDAQGVMAYSMDMGTPYATFQQYGQASHAGVHMQGGYDMAGGAGGEEPLGGNDQRLHSPTTGPGSPGSLVDSPSAGEQALLSSQQQLHLAQLQILQQFQQQQHQAYMVASHMATGPDKPGGHNGMGSGGRGRRSSVAVVQAVQMVGE